jgi:hypothetical protein
LKRQKSKEFFRLDNKLKEMYSEIIKRLRTKEETYQILDEVDLLLKTIYQNTSKYDDIIINDIRKWVKDMITSEIEKEKIDKEEYLKGLKEVINKLKVLDLTISFDPSSSTVNHISSWVRQNLGETVIINFIYDPKIIAGATISYNGRYIDLSLLAKFNQSFEEISGKIIQQI